MVGWKVGEGGPRQGGWQKIEEAYKRITAAFAKLK